MEDSVGSLESGKRADFIILNQNIFEIEASEIADTRVLQTWLDGELVYSYH
jgi:predicted amidohydrolase YtcJ